MRCYFAGGKLTGLESIYVFDTLHLGPVESHYQHHLFV